MNITLKTGWCPAFNPKRRPAGCGALAARSAENAAKRDEQSRDRKSRCSASRSAANLSIGHITQSHYTGIKRPRLHAPDEQKEFLLGQVHVATPCGNFTAEPIEKHPNSIRPGPPRSRAAALSHFSTRLRDPAMVGDTCVDFRTVVDDRYTAAIIDSDNVGKQSADERKSSSIRTPTQ